MSEWTDELKQEVVDKYTEANPTPDNSTELCKEIADEIEMTTNGVRMVLIQAGVYVKKSNTTTKSTTTKSGTGDGPKRVNKESSIADLAAAIEAKGLEADMDILSKLTGKAAVYLLSIVSA